MKYVLFSIILVLTVSVNAQESANKTRKELKAEKITLQKNEIKKLIENKSFVFEARTAYSSELGTKNLSSLYNVKVEKDSIYSYLPYYGRAYNVDYGSTESPMIFNVPVKELEIMKDNKKGYQVKVKVEKGMDNIVFSFNISEIGSATLTVTSNHRQVITYYGEIVEENQIDNSI